MFCLFFCVVWVVGFFIFFFFVMSALFFKDVGIFLSLVW